jgi:WD40 repeat protein
LFDYEKKEIEIVEISAVYNDANYEIIGSFNNQLCFNSLNKKNNLVGHVGGISAIDLSNHLRFFVTGSYDHSIRVWDFNGQLKDSIIFNNGGILDLKIIPDKNKIIMACKNSNIYLWNLETKKYRTFRGHNKIVNVIDISNNKDLFISGSRDSSIIIWNFNQENALLKKLYGHNGWITDLKISPNNEYFLSASTDGNIILWDFLGEKKETFTGHGSEVWNICWLSNTHFISSSRDNTICIWSINGNIIRLFSGNSSHVAKIIYNNETNKLNIYFLNGEVRIYKLNSNDIFDKNI